MGYTSPKSSPHSLASTTTVASQSIPRRLPVLQSSTPMVPIATVDRSTPGAAGIASYPPGPEPPHPARPPIAALPSQLKRKRDDEGDYSEARRNLSLMSRWVEPFNTPLRQPLPQVKAGSPGPPRPRPTVIVPQTNPTAAPPPPAQQTAPAQQAQQAQPIVPPAPLPPLSPKSKEREAEYLRHAKETYEWIKNVEETQGATVLRQMMAREQVVLPIDGDTVRNAIYELLKASNQVVSFPALRSVAQSVGQGPLEHDSIVDDEGNPYTEYILTFIDVFLVLFRPVSTSMIPLKVGIGQSGENDETDQKAFGALTATSLASRILILIPHAHHHVLRAVWLALTFLSAAYAGSKRGVAVKFLLDRLAEEWTSREEKRAKEGPAPVTEDQRREARVEAVWLKRARRVDELRQIAEKRTRSGLSLATIWAEMKGLGGEGPVRQGSVPGQTGESQTVTRTPPRPTALSQSPPRPTVQTHSPRRLDHTVLPSQALQSQTRQGVRPGHPGLDLHHRTHSPPGHPGLPPQQPTRSPPRQGAHPGQPIFQPYRTVHLAPEPSIAFRAAPVAPPDVPSPTASYTTIDSTTPSPKLLTLSRGLGVDVPPPSKVPRLSTPVPTKSDASPRMRLSLSPD